MSTINPNPLKLKSECEYTTEIIKELSANRNFMQTLDLLYDLFTSSIEGDGVVIQDREYIRLAINYPLSPDAARINMAWEFTALVSEDLYWEISENEKSLPLRGKERREMNPTMLRETRIRRGWTLKYTAECLGITKSAYRNIEIGIRKPSYDVLIKLLNLFEYSDPRLLFAVAAEQQSTPEGNPMKHITKT